MRISIIGAGFSGLATCWHLLNHPRFAAKAPVITVFDEKGIGGGASGMAAGLLHSYAGAHSKLNWRGTEGLTATKQLLKTASLAIGKPVADESGILRVALESKQYDAFHQCAQQYPDVEWLEAEKTQHYLPGMAMAPGILIKTGITVNCPLYLEGLWRACEQLGAKWKQSKVNSIEDLKQEDLIIVTAGASCAHFPELAALPLNYIKGQLVELSWPQDYPHMKLPINSYLYLVKHPHKPTCFAGATFERDFRDGKPDLKTALEKIRPEIGRLVPFLKESEVVDCQAGIRVSAPLHRPLYGKARDKLWYLTGMGSKGLLYHALFARELVDTIAAE